MKGPIGPRVLYGLHPVREALRAGRAIERAWVLPRAGGHLAELVGALGAAGVPVGEASREGLSRRAGSLDHQGVVALVEPLSNASLTGLVKDRPGSPLAVLVADGIQDPQNLGALLRLCDGAGVDLVFIPAHRSASVQLGSVAKASAGAVEHVRTVVVGDVGRTLGELEEKGFVIAMLSPSGGQAPWEVPLGGRLALVCGAEGRGPSPASRRAARVVVSIPMAGRTASLNVATAAAIVLFERARQLAMAAQRGP